MTRFYAQMGGILATALLGATLALAQSFLEAHGLTCSVKADPALAASSGAFLKAVHYAITSPLTARV